MASGSPKSEPLDEAGYQGLLSEAQEILQPFLADGGDVIHVGLYRHRRKIINAWTELGRIERTSSDVDPK